MVSIAGRRPRRGTVDLAVGDGDTLARVVAQDDVLAADERGGNVIDPDHVDVVEGDGIAAPDVLGVELGDVDVLDDDVAHAADEPQALALDDALAAHAYEALVGLDGDAELAGVVVLDRRLGRAGLVVVAPAVLVDGELAGGRGAPGCAARGRGGALGAGEVDGRLQVDDACG
ncbi:hypothetical protein G7046_g9552 [Stylonectria norvegica]|nr:hypothetical protein G7046_g9552 [Stylonectria norvegica]